MTGSWTKQDGLNQTNLHALAVYEKSIALKGLIGVNHRTTGVYYTQIVSGLIRYAFASEQAPVIPNPTYSSEWIYTEETSEGKVSPARSETTAPEVGGQFGGWSKHDGLNPENVRALGVYKAAISLDHRIGCQHRTTGVYYTQVVNGINYAFASEQAPVIPNPSFESEWVFTHESLDNKVSPAEYKDSSPI